MDDTLQRWMRQFELQRLERAANLAKFHEVALSCRETLGSAIL